MPEQTPQYGIGDLHEQLEAQARRREFLESDVWYEHELKAQEKHALETAIFNLSIISAKGHGWQSFAKSYKDYRKYVIAISHRFKEVAERAKTEKVRIKLAKIATGVEFIDSEVMKAIAQAER